MDVQTYVEHVTSFWVRDYQGPSTAGRRPDPHIVRNGWETPGGGFTYPSGSSIFDALPKGRMQWRVYVDENGPTLGGIPQVAALKGATYLVNTNALTSLASDLQGGSPPSGRPRSPMAKPV